MNSEGRKEKTELKWLKVKSEFNGLDRGRKNNERPEKGQVT
jgi:hypothetical protein